MLRSGFRISNEGQNTFCPSYHIMSIHGGQGYGMQRKHRKPELCGYKGR